MTHTMLSRFLLFSLLLHAGVLLFWPDGPLSGDPSMTSGAPLQLTLRSPNGDSILISPDAQALTEPRSAPDDRARPDRLVNRGAMTDNRSVAMADGALSIDESSRATQPERLEQGDAPTGYNAPAEFPAENKSMSFSDEEVRARLGEAVATHFYYPPLARRNGWEGEVLVDVRVEGDGRLSAIDVVGSSGYRVLDAAAVESLRRMARLSETAGLPEAGVVVTLSVRYMLVDGPA